MGPKEPGAAAVNFWYTYFLIYSNKSGYLELINNSFGLRKQKSSHQMCSLRKGFLKGLLKKHSHKKRKDSQEGSLDRVLPAAELEFPKILVPRLPQSTSDVNRMCRKVRMVKTTVFFTCGQLFGALIHLNFIILILICFYLWCLV